MMSEDSKLLHELYDEAIQLVQEMGHEDFYHSIEIDSGRFKIVIDPKKKIKHQNSEFNPTICVVFTFPFYNKEHDFKELMINQAKDEFFNQLREAVKLCQKNT